MNETAINKIRTFCYLAEFPDLPCPYCANEKLRLDRRSIRYKRLKNQFTEEDFENVEFESHRLLNLINTVFTAIGKMMENQAKFSTFLKCSSCKEAVIMVGKAIISSEWAKRQGSHVRTRILPEYFTPPLPIISLRSAYPKNIKIEITRSFATLFCDPASSGNAIRQSIERLLDNQGVEKTEIVKGGKQNFLSLSYRLKLFENKFSDAKLLRRIRFLGNKSSHHSTLNQEDLFTTYKIFQHVLDELYLRPRDREEILKVSQSLENKYKTR